MSMSDNNLSDLSRIFEKSEFAMKCFVKKDETELEKYFDTFNQIDFFEFFTGRQGKTCKPVRHKCMEQLLSGSRRHETSNR